MLEIIRRFRPIHVDAFTYTERYFDFYKPRSVHELTDDNSQRGHIIPLWSDLAINIINNDGFPVIKWAFCDADSKAQIHSAVQFKGFVSTERLQHLKIITPWQFKEKHGVKFVFFQPAWAHQKLSSHFSSISGITDFKYQTSTNIQMLINYPKEIKTDSILIEAGTPLYQFLPMSDRPLKFHFHLINEQLYNSINIPDKFSNMYFHRKKLIEKKCPFHSVNK